MMRKIINMALGFIARISLGRHMANALTLLRLIQEALTRDKSNELALVVYERLPADWRHPEGPTTEREFLDLIETGVQFLKRLHAVTTQ